MATGSEAADTRPAQRSLRRRLAWTLSGLVLVAAILQALLLNWNEYRAEEAMIDRLLEEQLARSIAIHRTQPELALPQDGDMRLYVLRTDVDVDDRALPAYLRALPRAAGRHEIHPAPGIEYHVAVARNAGTLFYLVYDVAEHAQRQRDTWAMLLLSVVIVAGLVGLIAHRLAARLLHDLDRLAHAATRTETGHDAFAPLAEHRETRALADALDAWRDRVALAIERERSFAAAANHELRTPLMRAGSSLELLAEGPHDARARALLARNAAAHEELRMLTESLLRVARGVTASAIRDESLAHVTRNVIASCASDAAVRGITVSSAVDDAVRLPLDRGALTIVLLNLLRNAIRHSGARHVTLTWQDGWLLVDDDGAGFGTSGPDRRGLGMTGADPAGVDAADAQTAGSVDAAPGEVQALGVGLTIVERICDACGWDVRIESRPHGGTRARVRLSPSPR